MAKKGVPKRDGSGKGRRANAGRGGHKPLKIFNKGENGALILNESKEI